MKRLVLIGAGGHARAVIDVIRAQGECELAGIVDAVRPAKSVAFGVEILGDEGVLPRVIADRGIDALFIAIGDNFQRSAMAGRLRAAMPEVALATLIHPSAVVGGDVQIGPGSVIMPGAVVMGGSSVGEGCVVNTRSALDHDGSLAPWASLGPGVTTGGRAHVGTRSFIGLGAMILQGVSIGSDVVVGAGSLVLRDIPDGMLAMGSPCRPIRSRTPAEPYF